MDCLFLHMALVNGKEVTKNGTSKELIRSNYLYERVSMDNKHFSK